MPEPVKIIMGGYGPPTTSFSRALKFIGDRMERAFGDDVEVRYVWNILDLGYKGSDIFWLAESGVLTIVYQSTSYISNDVPELGFVDLPFLFSSNEQARAAMDGALGRFLSGRIEDRFNFKMLGYFENGFRHISNKVRPVHRPEDLKGLKIRVLPSDTQARTFALLGADPQILDLSTTIDYVTRGVIDAQENPFANTVTYGVHNFHPYHTMSGHFYISRGIFANRTAYYGWPPEMKAVMAEAVRDAVAIQRNEAEQEVVHSRAAIEDAGCEIVTLSPDELDAFRAKVRPQMEEARRELGDQLFRLLDEAGP